VAHGRRGGRSPDEIVRLARERLGTRFAVYDAPAIPPEKEARVRAVHAAHLPESEPILVLHDATVFGGADDGFAVTAERLCWKNLFEHPRQIAWSDLDPSTVLVGGGHVGVAGGGVALAGELVEGAGRFFSDMASRVGLADESPYRRGADAPLGTPEGEALAVARIAALARRHLGEIEQVFYHPAIPAPKLRRARVIHAAHLRTDETVAVLYDDTLLGSAEEGFLVTPRRLCWKNLVGEAASAEWSDVDPGSVAATGNQVYVARGAPALTTRAALAPSAAGLFTALAVAARGEERLG
jgi:hypothetical protein